MNTKRTAVLIALVALLVTIWPAFVNHYYDECLSQNLAPVCYPLEWPTILELKFYLFG